MIKYIKDLKQDAKEFGKIGILGAAILKQLSSSVNKASALCHQQLWCHIVDNACGMTKKPKITKYQSLVM